MQRREEHTKKNLTFETKKSQGEASPGWGRAPRCGRSPRMAWGPPAAGCPVVKCSVPVPLHLPGRTRQRARAAGQAGQGSRGRTAAFSTHTLCNTTATTSVRPSASRRGRTDTPARRSRTPVGYRGNSGRGWRAHAPPSKPCWWGTTACRGTAGSARSGTCGGEEQS